MMHIARNLLTRLHGAWVLTCPLLLVVLAA